MMISAFHYYSRNSGEGASPPVVWSAQCLIWPFLASIRSLCCARAVLVSTSCIVQSWSFFPMCLGTSPPIQLANDRNGRGGKLHRYNIMRMANSTIEGGVVSFLTVLSFVFNKRLGSLLFHPLVIYCWKRDNMVKMIVLIADGRIFFFLFIRPLFRFCFECLDQGWLDVMFGNSALGDLIIFVTFWLSFTIDRIVVGQLVVTR